MLVNYTLIFVSLVLFAGMAVDAGILEQHYLQLQTGANAAAVASTLSLQRNAAFPPTSGATAASITTAVSAGKSAAAANGFTDGVNGVTVTVTVTPISSSYSATILATIKESLPPTFLGILGLGSVSMQAQASREQGVPVNLSSYYNVIGIYTDGTSFASNGGFDENGYAFSANLLGQVRESSGLGAIVSWRGQIFNFAAANAANGVSQSTISLPHGRTYSQLLIVGSTAWAYYPSSIAGTFVVTYSDGSTASTTFSLSDWLYPQYYSGETIVSTQAYRENDHSGVANTQVAQNYMYGYTINVDNTKTLSTLKLPTQRNFVLFGLDVIP
jgi:hypothetical protein